jgi:hypothetical protein
MSAPLALRNFAHQRCNFRPNQQGGSGVFAGICFGFGRVLVERKGGMVAGGRGQRRDWPEIKLRGGRRAATRLGRRSLASRVGTVMDKMIDQGVQETA